jgi:hypothetical protein
MRSLSEERTRVRFFFMVVDLKAGLLALLVGREDSVDEEEAEPVGLLSVGESVGALVGETDGFAVVGDSVVGAWVGLSVGESVAA